MTECALYGNMLIFSSKWKTPFSRSSRYHFRANCTSAGHVCNVEGQRGIIQNRRSGFLHRIVHSINQVSRTRGCSARWYLM